MRILKSVGSNGPEDNRLLGPMGSGRTLARTRTQTNPPLQRYRADSRHVRTPKGLTGAQPRSSDAATDRPKHAYFTQTALQPHRSRANSATITPI